MSVVGRLAQLVAGVASRSTASQVNQAWCCPNAAVCDGLEPDLVSGRGLGAAGALLQATRAVYEQRSEGHAAGSTQG